MARMYNLACPIARALDALGDRWTLLILRDLHAGPVRFTELNKGIPGMAPNLLTERLQSLCEVGVVQRVEAPHGVSLYELTALGRRTSPLFFELAKVGAALPLPADLRRLAPGNLRHLAVVLEHGANSVAPPDLDLRAGILMDDEPFAIVVEGGVARVRYEHITEPDVVIATSYDMLIGAIEGRVSPKELSASVERRHGTAASQAKLRPLVLGALQQLAGFES